jgi:tRNA 2-thiouridine synthesizing protein A
VIEVLSTDAGSATDIPAWVTKAQHELLAATERDGATSFVVRKAR